MAQPTPYSRLYNFTQYATANPSAPYQPAYTDAELNAIATTLRETLINISLIQRDDGALKNGVVTQDSLSATLAALFATAGSTIRGDWVTATVYALKDVATQGGVTYICAIEHTSGTFATDLAADKWVALNSGTTIAAANVTSTPSGDVIATNVDAAIAELASEKLAKAQNLADLASRATAFANLVAGGGTVTGALTMSGARINTAQGTSIDSAVAAGTLDLDAATGNDVTVTGTTTVTAVTLSPGRFAFVTFSGVLTLTNSASLKLPGASNITTAAGDSAIFLGVSAGVVRAIMYTKASGLATVVATAPGALLNTINFTAQTVALSSISNASPAVLTCSSASHLPENGSPIRLTTSGTLPTGLATGTDYYVVGASGSTFNVAATKGGSAINTTGAGSGTHTMNSIYVKNSSAASIEVEAWGGGGGAAGTDSSPSVGSGGGGAGGFSRRTILNGSVASTETVTIGAGGAAGASTPGAGGNGSDTTFGSLLTAKGGTGSAIPSGAVGPGGAGGVRATNGDFNLAGNGGGPGGGNVEIGGNGGATSLGGVTPATGGSTSAGADAVNNSGSGGSGGYTNTTSVVGGAGGSGRVIVREYS